MKLPPTCICFNLMIALLAAMLPLPSPGQVKILDTNQGLFQYRQKVDIDLRIDSVIRKNNISIRDVSFSSCNPVHGRIRAYLISPVGASPCAGIVFFHWLGTPLGNRDEFLDEAISFAGRNVKSLLIQGYFPWMEEPVAGEKDRQQVIDQTIDLQRAVDILYAQPMVDTSRIAFVGHDYGAMFGSILAGIDHRIKAYVLITAMGNFSDWSLKYWEITTDNHEAYRKALAPVDPLGYIGAALAKLFFQFSEDDMYISNDKAMEFYDAAREPKQIRWYKTGHEMRIPEAKNDRMNWLEHQLKLTSGVNNQ